MLLLRTKLHAVLSAIYHGYIPLETGSWLSGFLKDSEGLDAIVVQKDFSACDGDIFSQLNNAYRDRGQIQYLSTTYNSKAHSTNTMRFFRDVIHKTMDENSEEMDRVYMGFEHRASFSET